MSLQSQIIADGAAFTDTTAFGESATYTPYNGSPVTVQVVVTRYGPYRIGEASHGLTQKFEVDMPNNSSTGRTSISVGKDIISLPDRIGGTAADRIVVNILDSDVGMWKLEVR